jgi:hypothetical protein
MYSVLVQRVWLRCMPREKYASNPIRWIWQICLLSPCNRSLSSFLHLSYLSPAFRLYTMHPPCAHYSRMHTCRRCTVCKYVRVCKIIKFYICYTIKKWNEVKKSVIGSLILQFLLWELYVPWRNFASVWVFNIFKFTCVQKIVLGNSFLGTYMCRCNHSCTWD